MINSKNIFYIYVYLDSNNIPFYVGKGKGGRYLVSQHLSKNTTNTFLKRKIRKVGINNVKIKFLHKELTEKDASHRERYWIKYYGRRDLGLGTLCNLTDGGEGMSGWTCSEETKRKLSESHKGLPSLNKGCKHTNATKQKNK